MKIVGFVPQAFSDFNEWVIFDRKIYAKIVELIKDIQRDPFDGIGKPEPLKHAFKGLWSRRISQEHRLVYEVRDDRIVIHSCKYHYGK
jgi:toxin YoeB